MYEKVEVGREVRGLTFQQAEPCTSLHSDFLFVLEDI